LHFVGLDPSSLLTTSAVITAVLAFAMQDTLGNVLSGVALQLDNSLRTGDWIRIDDLTGRVAQIRWRQTTIRTRNGEVVIVPNSQLMRGRFTVYGRADIPNWPWRRWIWFNITHDSAPRQVIEEVEKAISAADIPNVAADPAPTCVLMEFGPGYARYALRYWMLDPQPDDPTDSAVRVHVLAALQRGGMQLAVPEQSLLVTKENEAYRKSIRRRETERRVADLRKLELFSGLQEEELRTISEHLIFAPFASGDVIYHQGDAAHWLYLLTSGEAEVWMEIPEQPRQLFRTIHAGSTFGERGVMTGENRRDTVIAKTDAGLLPTGSVDGRRDHSLAAGDLRTRLPRFLVAASAKSTPSCASSSMCPTPPCRRNTGCWKRSAVSSSSERAARRSRSFPGSRGR
jgi:small-conductance mechanosensitive channel